MLRPGKVDRCSNLELLPGCCALPSHPRARLPAPNRRLYRASGRENLGCRLHSARLRSWVTAQGLSKLPEQLQGSALIFPKSCLNLIYILPLLPSLPNSSSLSSPPRKGHVFQESKWVHQPLFLQIQWTALQSATTSLADTKRNSCFTANDLPCTVALDSAAEWGPSRSTGRTDVKHCHQQQGNT